MERFFWLITALLLSSEAIAQEKWVWNNRDSKAGLARDDGKGRYGVYEPEIPDEPFRPAVRPPPAAGLPPLIRPSGRPPPSNQFNNHNNNNYRPHQFPTNSNFNNIDNNPPFPPTNFNNNRRPYQPTVDGSFPSYPGRPNPGHPSVNPSIRPPQFPPGPAKRPDHHPDNKDPTNFDKCKCVHSFNCKSPAILFGTCDVGKKYCCEKFTASRPQGRNEDFADPEILVGPGGPVDHLIKGQDNYHRPGGSFGRLPQHSSFN